MQITENVMEGICLLFLWLCAIFDIRSKEIPAVLLGAGLFTTYGTRQAVKAPYWKQVSACFREYFFYSSVF